MIMLVLLSWLTRFAPSQKRYLAIIIYFFSIARTEQPLDALTTMLLFHFSRGQVPISIEKTKYI